MANEDVLIKVAADIAQAVTAMQTMVAQMGDVVKSITDTNKAAEDGKESTKSFWEEWVTGADKGKAAGEAWGKQMSKAIDDVKQGIKDVITGLPNMVTAAAAAGDEFFTLSNRLNVSVESLAELDFIAGQSGANMEGLARSIQEMGVNLADAESKSAKAIKGLGLSVQELKKADPTEAFFKILETIKQTVPVADQGAKAMEIFGGKFRMNTMLLKEDIAGLRADFKELGGGMTTDLAVAGDAYGDNLKRIEQVQNNFRNSIARAVLPALNDLLEKFPQAGGAALTFGEGIVDLAKSFIPLLGNLALLKSSGFATSVMTWAATIPGFTTAMGLATTAVKGFVAVLGPLAIAITGAFLAWKAWQKATEESGWIREVSDAFEYASLRIQGYSAAQADAMIAGEHVREQQKKLNDQLKDTEEKLKASGGAVRAQKSGWDDLSGSMAEARAGLKALTAEQRAMIKAALDAGVSLSDIHDKTGVATNVLNLFNKELDASKKAFESSAFGKLKKQLEELGPAIALALASGRDMTLVLEQFGKQAEDAVNTAKLIPGALDKVPESVKKVAAAFEASEMKKTLDEIHKKTLDIAGAWGKQLREDALRFAEVINKDVAAAIKHVADLNEQYELDQRTGIDKRLAAIQNAEEEELRAVQNRDGVSQQLRDQETAAIKRKYDDQRKLAAKYTGDVVRDAELRGQKTKAEAEKELAVEEKHLADMLAHREKFTDEVIDQQRQIVENAKESARGASFPWLTSLGAMSQAFAQLGQIAGGSLSAITQSIGTAVGSMNTFATSMKGMKQGFSKGGFEGILGGLTNMVGMIGAGIQIGTMVFKGLKQIFGKHPDKDIARDVGGDFGIRLADETAKAWAAEAKEKFKGNLQATELFHLNDIIQQMGGVTTDNLKKITGKVHDLFSMISTGAMTTEQASEVIDQVWPQMMAVIDKNGGLITEDMRRLIELNKEYGTSSQAMQEFVNQQLDKLAGGLNKAIKGLPEAQKATSDVIKSFSKEQQDQLKKDFEAAQKSKDGFEGSFEDFVAQQANFYNTLQEGDERLKTVFYGDDLKKWNDAKENWQKQFDRLSRIALASFNAMRANGKSLVDSIDAIGDTVDQLKDRQEKLGLASNSSFDALNRFRGLVQTNRDLVESVGGLNEVMVALANTGSLDAQTFADLQAEGADAFKKLTAAGFTQEEALTQLKPMLETIIKLHKEKGLAIDDETQKMIDQAEQNGILAAEQESTQDILKEGLGELIKVLGGQLPAAWSTAARAGVDAMSRVQTAVGGVQGKLGGTDWDGWASEAEDAAARAEDAVTGVAEGHSPSGIKQIIERLRQTMLATRQFSDVWDEAMSNAHDMATAVSQVSTQQAATGAIKATVGAAQQAQAASQTAGDTLNIEIQSFDSTGVETAMERKLLPALTAVLGRGRGLRDLQQVLNTR